MKLNAQECLRIGRYDKNEEHCCLWWSGSGIRLTAACKQLTLEAEHFAVEHAPWLAVLVDGSPVARFPMLPGKRTYPILDGMDRAFPHEVTILRDSQPMPDEEKPIAFYTIESDGDIQAAPARSRLLEFIGDSLTVGEGCAGPRNAEEWRMAWLCNAAAFPTLVSEAMQTEKRVIALSGWGAWKSWDAMEAHRLGAVYEKLCAAIPAGDIPYAFDERKADAVVINLGTNDGNALKQEPDREAAAKELTARCMELIRMVRRRQPCAPIIWAYGLCGYDVEKPIRDAVNRLTQSGEPDVLFLRLDDCMGDVGSRQHPSRAAHRRAAAQIEATLRGLWSET